jgi:hypothetical protein
MIDGWPLYSGLPPSIPAIKVQDKSFEEFAQGFAQSARVNGIPKREWVALTDDEVFTSWKYYADIVREVEAKLKEKNNG